jgi:type II secretory pathway predicted ATPase ExeA
MYEAYWKLNGRPFHNDAVPDFFFRGETHQAAMLKLRYAIEHRLGAALLTGGVGYGKSFLIQTLASELSAAFSPVILLVFPQLSPPELLAWLAVELGVPAEIADEGRLDQTLRHLELQFQKLTKEGRSPTIIIDEAHTIESAAVLQTFQLLLNYQQQPSINFTMVFVGDRPLVGQVSRWAALDERIPIRAMLQPLSRQETAAYVKHRLAVAGRKQPAFDEAALTSLFQLTGGVPRRINRLCDLALLVGYADQLAIITEKEMEAVGEEINVGLTV